jgi:hypothetical protein
MITIIISTALVVVRCIGVDCQILSLSYFSTLIGCGILETIFEGLGIVIYKLKGGG